MVETCVTVKIQTVQVAIAHVFNASQKNVDQVVGVTEGGVTTMLMCTMKELWWGNVSLCTAAFVVQPIEMKIGQ